MSAAASDLILEKDRVNQNNDALKINLFFKSVFSPCVSSIDNKRLLEESENLRKKYNNSETITELFNSLGIKVKDVNYCKQQFLVLLDSYVLKQLNMNMLAFGKKRKQSSISNADASMESEDQDAIQESIEKDIEAIQSRNRFLSSIQNGFVDISSQYTDIAFQSVMSLLSDHELITHASISCSLGYDKQLSACFFVLTLNSNLTELSVNSFYYQYSDEIGMVFSQLLQNSKSLRILNLEMSDIPFKTRESYDYPNPYYAERNNDLSYPNYNRSNEEKILRALGNHQSLQALRLEADFAGGRPEFFLEGLKSNIALLSLDLSHCKIGGSGYNMRSTDIARDLVQACVEHPALERLNLSNNNLDGLIDSFVSMLRTNQKLKSLLLRQTNMQYLIPLIQVLEHNTTLTDLDVEEHCHEYRPEDHLFANTQNIYEMAKSIHKWSIQKLNISGRVRENKSAFELIKALVSQPTITSLQLSHNHFTDLTVGFIVNMINRNLNLTYLNLSHNHFTYDPGLVLICDAIKENSTLQTVNLYAGRNYGSNSLRERFKNILEYNSSLTSTDPESTAPLDSSWRETYWQDQVVETDPDHSFLEENKEIQSDQKRHWGRVGILTAFYRANAGNPLQNSVHPLIPSIMNFISPIITKHSNDLNSKEDDKRKRK